MTKWLISNLMGLFGLLCSGLALAEGNCPPGFYPIGGQGVQGCAPIPGAQSTGAGAPVVDAPRVPTGRWHDSWGALAASPSTAWAGAATGESNKQRAESIALEKCREHGPTDCRVMMSYYNQCAAWVVPKSKKGGGSGIGRGPTIERAIAQANKICTDPSGAGCEAVYTDCTKPTFEKF